MKIERFIKECGQSTIFTKTHKIKITIQLLEELEFIKDDYDFHRDMLALAEKIVSRSDFIPPEEPAELDIIYEHKDLGRLLRHLILIKRRPNQKYIMASRKELGMPFINKGFKLMQENDSLSSHFTNWNFEWAEPAFKEWFFSFAEGREYTDEYEKWEKTSSIVFRKIHEIITRVLEKWKLSKRYREAIEELLIFNRIIPAGSGIHDGWYRERDGSIHNRITWEDDIMKADMESYIRQFFKKDKKVKRYGNPRNFEEDQKIINLFNKLKKKGQSDRKAFTETQLHFREKSIRAIRKIVKGS